jgi:F0F1-type ATP synthase epsilon subunit
LVLEDGTVERIAVPRGILFVDQDHRVIVLADIAELSSQVDVRRAEARIAQLEQRLSGGDDAVLRMSLQKQRLRVDVARGA